MKHILDNSNSPMETKLAMAAVLPFLQGGFALKHLEMNRYVALTPQGRALLGIDSCCCDMVWDQEKIILEYDSNLTHLEARQHAMDKKRASALSMAGCKVISITADVLHNFTAFEKTFLSLRWTLGMRTDQHRFASCRRQRYDLYQFLLRH
ncbi:MAG: hypothetical protein IJ106_13035 [Parasporobacterium sp.]|nr:hypothetical protein [Parasporobacterium sp.]